MGRLPHACVRGCIAPDCLMHYIVCPVMERALEQFLGPRPAVLGLVADGIFPQWRHVAAPAEAYSTAGSVRTAAKTAALAIADEGRDRIQN